MSDLVDRLRDIPWSEDQRMSLTIHEAADALEQQAGEIERLRAERNNTAGAFTLLRDANVRLKAENAELRAEMQREHIDNAQTVEDAAAVVRENAELRKDAERYRWLRNVGTVKGVIDWNALEWEYHNLPAMDAAIDAAMEGKK